MPARLARTTAREGTIQQLDFGDQVLLGPSPVWQRLAARTADLEPKQLDDSVMNAVVVRFDDAFAVFVTEPEQAPLFDRGPYDRINVRVWRQVRFPNPF